jgi:ribonuclease HI
MNQTYIFTDGACLGNPGPGGYGLIIIENNYVQERGAFFEHTTNNKMEMIGVITGLHLVDSTNPIMVLTDSEYVIKGITQWIPRWKQKNWKTAAGNSVANQALWIQMESLSQGKSITWQHIRGHRGYIGNERAHTLASAFAEKKRIPLYQGPLCNYVYKDFKNDLSFLSK